MGPKAVWAAVELHSGSGSQVALEKFSVVADRFDDARGEVVIEADELPKAVLDPKQAPDDQVVTLFLFRNICLRDAAFIGLD